MDNADPPPDKPQEAGSFYNKAPRFSVFGSDSAAITSSSSLVSTRRKAFASTSVSGSTAGAVRRMEEMCVSLKRSSHPEERPLEVFGASIVRGGRSRALLRMRRKVGTGVLTPRTGEDLTNLSRQG
jgi:hypothetical protein